MPDNRKTQRDDKQNKQQPPKRDGGTNVGSDTDRDEDQIITQRNPRMDDQNKGNSDSDDNE